MPTRDEAPPRRAEEQPPGEIKTDDESAPDVTRGRKRLVFYIFPGVLIVAAVVSALLFFLLPGKSPPQPTVSAIPEEKQPSPMAPEQGRYLHLNGFHVELPDGKSLLVGDFTLVMTSGRDDPSEKELISLRTVIYGQLRRKNPEDLMGAERIGALKLQLMSAVDQFFGETKQLEQILITRFFVI